MPRSNAWIDRLRALRNVRIVLEILWKATPKLVCVGLALRILQALSPITAAYIAKYILNDVQAVLSRRPLPPFFWRYVVSEVFVVIATNLLIRATEYIDALLADRWTHHASLRILDHAAKLDLQTYEDPAFQNCLERARLQATDRISIIPALSRLFQFSLQVLFFAVFLLWWAPFLLLLLAISALPSFLGDTHFAFLGYEKDYGQTTRRRRLNYIRLLGSSKDAAKELRLYNLAQFLSDRYSRISRSIYVENAEFSVNKFLWGGCFALLNVGGYYAAYLYIISGALHQQYDIGSFAFMTRAIQQVQGYMQLVLSTASGIADQALFLLDLIDLFKIKASITSVTNPQPLPVCISRGFEFRNVAFAYPGSNRKVVEGLTFQLRPGERVALIGENGQGKTTIVKLMTRLYEPTEGSILLDGVDLREYNLDVLHRSVGVIFQDFMRYEMTVKENIAVGRIDQQISDAEIASAAKKALAHEVIERLTNGYDQMLGRYFDGGTDLSGGEWQRIALARAYLREAQLLILDEPTASLDVRSELEAFDQFAKLTVGKMALLVSHRFSTVRMADRILVLSGGRIVEEGDHATLIALNGRYAEMFDMQAASYR